MGIIEERRRIRSRVVSEAMEWARSLGFKCTAVLIGSYARGDFNEWSDIDIVLVSEIFRDRPPERLRKIETPPNYEVIPLNPTELERLFTKRDPIADEICRHGVFLRDDYMIQNTYCNK